MTNCKEVILREASIDDLDLLRHWDEQPHVKDATGGDDWQWETQLYLHPDWREQLIAEADGTPIGYIEIIDPAREIDHCWGDVPEHLRAIDIWIGETEYLGKGYGTEMMRLAIERCFSEPDVTAILIDPLESNTRSHLFYERLGFKFIEKWSVGEADCRIYRLDQADWVDAN